MWALVKPNIKQFNLKNSLKFFNNYNKINSAINKFNYIPTKFNFSSLDSSNNIQFSTLLSSDFSAISENYFSSEFAAKKKTPVEAEVVEKVEPKKTKTEKKKPTQPQTNEASKSTDKKTKIENILPNKKKTQSKKNFNFNFNLFLRSIIRKRRWWSNYWWKNKTSRS